MKILLLILVIGVIVGLVVLARRSSGPGPASTPDDVHPTGSPEAPQPPRAADPDGPGLPEDGEPGTPPWDGLR